jgi:hypothetical protein
VVTAEINEGWGRLTWGENAWGAAGDVVATGNQLSISFESNQDAWGDLTWSDYNTRWGGVGSVDVGIFNEIPITQNQELNSTTNSVTITIATEVFLSENPLNALTISEGTVDPAPDVMPSGVNHLQHLLELFKLTMNKVGVEMIGVQKFGALKVNGLLLM